MNLCKKCFLDDKLFFLLILSVIFKFSSCHANESAQLNSTIFRFRNLNLCRRNEFYDLDYFTCNACSDGHDKMQPNADKLSCKCPESTLTVYEPSKPWPSCVSICSVVVASSSVSTETADDDIEDCAIREQTAHCRYRYVNQTGTSKSKIGTSRAVYISAVNVQDVSDCSSCDPFYNFRYHDYCIGNALLKPYLHYNSFWQATTNSNAHFGDLKFVAFFCLSLHNMTACNQLANLCVQSHYSLDKNSPCSVFLLTQVSDVSVMRYAYAAEQGDVKTVKPFLFYRKGKATAKMLATPIENLRYQLVRHGGPEEQQLQLFSTTFALNGKLKRLGAFSLAHVNLCQLHATNSASAVLYFAQRSSDIECRLTLENLIDLARIYANDNFISVYLNHSRHNTAKDQYVQQLPVLIETLMQENQRSQREDWQLVKRFQLFETHIKNRFTAQSATTYYEDRQKLLHFRSLRYVERFELHYDIHAGNRISVPIIKLSFKHIEFTSSNNTLSQLYPFKLSVTFSRSEEGAHRQLLVEVALPTLLILTLIAALLRANNSRQRRGASDLCDIACFFEFLLRLISNLAHALLLTTVLLIVFNSVEYLTQRQVQITLPLIKHPSALDSLLGLALILKLAFVVVHLWRVSHYDLFLIDWERPRSCDNNHFNLKSNLETASVCSSVRTYVAENNVSAWRILFTANEWIRLSISQKYSTFIQAFVSLIVFQILDQASIIHQDRTLECFFILIIYMVTYVVQMLVRRVIMDRIFGDPLQKFIDLCSLANISVFTLLESSYGYYLHGRSPHGFADTDMTSMIMQLQREAQNMCGRRGLLSDSDKQAYIILPPKNLRIYLERLLVPFQRSYSITQTHYQKEISTIDGNVERTSIAYASVNRFFCAFIDHAIKDMDYIIKEKSFLENFLDCEIDNYLTENKGTFYIDNNFSFGRLTLLGNELHLFILELLMLLTFFHLTASLIVAVAVICACNLLIQCAFRYWIRQNVSKRTLIDQRFLM